MRNSIKETAGASGSLKKIRSGQEACITAPALLLKINQMKNLSEEEKEDRKWRYLIQLETGISEFTNIWEEFVNDIIPLTPFKIQPPNYAELTGELLKDINNIDEKYFQRGFQAVVHLTPSDLEYYFEKKGKGLWTYGYYANDGYYRSESKGTFRDALTHLLKRLNAKVLGITNN